MSKSKNTITSKSTNLPEMTREGGLGREKNSATIPSMDRAPGTSSTSQGGTSSGGVSSDKTDESKK